MEGTTCTAEEYISFKSSKGASMVCLSRGESIGLALVAESALISLLAVTGVFCLIIRNAFRNKCLFKRPADIYMISLFMFDFIMAVGHVLDLRWVQEGKIQVEGYCTAQGIIQQIGETGSALSTLAIAIFSVVAVLWGKLSRNFLAAYLVVSFTWIFVALLVGIGYSQRGPDSYETPDGYWCWIGASHPVDKYLGEYVWMWVAMFVSFLAYTPLFFWARGNLSIDPAHWWKIHLHKNISEKHSFDPDGRKRRAMGLIAYPLVFALIILPFSVVRWTSNFGTGKNKLTVLTFATQFLYSLSGTFNVLLFIFTRTGLLIPHGTRARVRRAFFHSSDGSTSVGDIEVAEARWAFEELPGRTLSIQRNMAAGPPVPLKGLPNFDDRSSYRGSVHKVPVPSA
ncbi:hypothetical protein FIBSPDRAFT_963895 [Athelia psychrophila]|uniref:Uncharacterized protein n=1 Tax=Athelia psychrophila TaxID=1759441 RepID=A0A165YFD2_9AGAM|nr:hypothetical protein FIBSPDRAFT_963895 [Fibularhizoctonia sp. CBS 109695]